MEVEDLAGLNRTNVAGLPIVGDEATARALLGAAAPKSLAAAGMSHSQGGHALRKQGQVLLTETMRVVHYDPQRGTVTAEAGATWSQIHHVLRGHGRAPLVHQSSGHFSVGGSIAVNCHGRDPRQGPLGNTVRRLWVLCGDGQVREASRNQHADLFAAVVGGYGACGLILRAELDTTEEALLAEVWARHTELEGYIDAVLHKLPARAGWPSQQLQLHYAWLCFAPGPRFLDEVVYVDYPEVSVAAGVTPADLQRQTPAKDEAWGTSEIMRAAWAAAKTDDTVQQALWNQLRYPTPTAPGALDWPADFGFGTLRTIGERQPPDLRSNWMRASVGFTASRGRDGADGRGHTDMLQEYFVPLGAVVPMVQALREALRPGNAAGIRLLSCTLRLVQADAVGTLLGYAPAKRACLALDLIVPVDHDQGRRAPTAAAQATFRGLIDRALELGGTYYLPYYRFADRPQFERAYGPGAQRLRQAIARYDPERKFWNEFLEAYVG
jgi:FAD/FMN-containing dehydrogenase